ncbi:hypothetical protein [Bradyrhizobium sp. U531]|uniref:hypothetical protein n=1 Tax=Bradyrhizobium sp. U531 TaxID=3053458 RepID=UPI003F684E77
MVEPVITICRPTGDPAAVKPHGTLAAGSHDKLNGYKNSIRPIHPEGGVDQSVVQLEKPRPKLWELKELSSVAL